MPRPPENLQRLPNSRVPLSLFKTLLTCDLAQAGALVLPAVSPDAHVASVGALHIGHAPIHHTQHHQGGEDAEDKRPASQDELSLLLPGIVQARWERIELGIWVHLCHSVASFPVRSGDFQTAVSLILLKLWIVGL